MSHDTHTDHPTHASQEGEKKSKTGLRSAFWFVLILAGLYLAAINFVKVESREKGEGYKTEAATSNETMKEEGGSGKTEGATNASPATGAEPATRPNGTPQGADTAAAQK